MIDLGNWDPQNQWSWWQALAFSVLTAAVAGGLLLWMYESRSQAVPARYVAVLTAILWVGFFLITGVDRKLPSSRRAVLALIGTTVVFVGAAGAALGTVLY